MSLGNFGTVRPADIRPSDAEIFVHYTPNRSSVGNEDLVKYDGTDLLVETYNPNNTNLELFGGLYTLKLPVTDFALKGIYTIVIKPTEIRTKIVDCGVLSSLPDNRGIIFDIASLPTQHQGKFINNGLVGYRVEYLNDTIATDVKINNFFRVITSNNRVEAINVNLTNSNQKANRYTFNDNSSLTFCTLSPSSAPSVKPNAIPFIGSVGQNVIITNTFFNPIMVEIEMVEHDIETLAYALLSNQTKSLEDGIYTIYNFQNQIYKQYNLYEIKEQFDGKPLFEVREKRDSIDFTKGFNDITNI
jgi:hypothetical protein